MPDVSEIDTRLDIIETSANVIRALVLPGATPRQREMMAIAATELAFQAREIAISLEPAAAEAEERKGE